jgi:hypothetical protein
MVRAKAVHSLMRSWMTPDLWNYQAFKVGRKNAAVTRVDDEHVD